METPTNKKERFLRMAPGNRKTQIISKAALQSMLNQAAKDSSTTASARIGVREHLNQSNVSSAGVTGANRTTEVHHGSSGEGDTTNHTNESGIPQTLEVSNQNQNLNAAEGSTGNLQDTSVADKASIPKRRRGQTMGKGIMKAFHASGKKLKIDVDPLIGRPKSREQSAKLSSQIGVVARDVLPVPRKWKEMAEEKLLEPGMDHIKIHMDVNLDVPGVRHCLVDRLKSSSRQIRYRLHKHYKKYATPEEAKKNKPPFCASKENWDELCDYFASPKFKHQSSTNTMNRQMLRTPHISGRTPFSTLPHEIAEKNANRVANGDANGDSGDIIDAGDIIEFYKLTHCTDKHGWSTDEAKENWELMVSRREKYTAEGAEKTNQEIVHEVLGERSTYLKGLGYQTNHLNKRIYAPANQYLQKEKELQETQEKIIASESRVSELMVQVNDMKNLMGQQGADIEKLMAFMTSKGNN